MYDDGCGGNDGAVLLVKECNKWFGIEAQKLGVRLQCHAGKDRLDDIEAIVFHPLQDGQADTDLAVDCVEVEVALLAGALQNLRYTLLLFAHFVVLSFRLYPAAANRVQRRDRGRPTTL